MNMSFKASLLKPWTLTDDKIICKSKEILLSELTEVTFSYPDSPTSNAVIQVFYGKGFFPKFLTLAVPYERRDEGRQAYEYILGIVSGEDAVSEDRKKFEVQKDIKENGYKKYCNVCGHIFCYTLDDLKKNKELKSQEGLNLVSSFAGGLSGNYAAGATSLQTANDSKSRIVDYDKCPACGSRDIRDATEEDINKKKQSQTTATFSAADELKKFKELLDMGVISNEEFNAKKKELLGL